MSSFRFKRFTIEQERCAMKVGTDGVLLGAWCSVVPNARHALDIGSGSGLIALMVAQRGEAWGLRVDGVEPDEGSAEQSQENVAASPWRDNVRIINTRLQDFETDLRYDLIVSNPPYFADSLLPPNAARSRARHTDSLDFAELARGAAHLLTADGRFAVIVPRDRAADMVAECVAEGLFPLRRTDVIPKEGAPAKRTMLEFYPRTAAAAATTTHSTLTILAAGRQTPDYRTLTAAFYLNF
jgi:tRNA1Val (adenine37-N6)-methyltransferase